jgi:hypothetical protein
MEHTRQNIGTSIDRDLYREIRALALMRGCNAGEIIDAALRLYLEAESSKTELKRTRAIVSPKPRHGEHK